MNDRAGQRPRHAIEGPDPGGYELAQPPLLQSCAQQSVMASPKARRVRHFTALSVLWFVLAMVLWSRLAQGRVWDKLTHWLQDRDPQRPQEPAGASALSYQRERLGVEPVKQLFEQGTHVLCEQQTPGAWYRGHRLMALDGSLFNVPDTQANAAAGCRAVATSTAKAPIRKRGP